MTDHGRQQQPALPAQRLLEDLRGAGKSGRDGGREDQLPFHVLNSIDRFAERDPRRQIERNGHRRKLALVIDRERPRCPGHGRHGRKRHQLAGGRAHERLRQAFGFSWYFGSSSRITA